MCSILGSVKLNIKSERLGETYEEIYAAIVRPLFGVTWTTKVQPGYAVRGDLSNVVSLIAEKLPHGWGTLIRNTLCPLSPTLRIQQQKWQAL